MQLRYNMNNNTVAEKEQLTDSLCEEFNVKRKTNPSTHNGNSLNEELRENIFEVPRSYVLNPRPQFIPPVAYAESVDVEDLDKALSICRHEKNKARLDAIQAVKAKKSRTKAHWFIKKLVSKANGVDIFRSNVMLKILGERGRKVYIHRERVVNELVKALASFHDVFSGICERSTLTSLSDQIGATTYGNKEYCEVDEGAEPQLARKKSISRVSRAIDDMVRWGLIEVTNERDRITGKYIGAVVRITPRFYDALSVEMNDVETARWDKIRQMQRENQLPSDLDMEESLDNYIKKKLAAVIRARQEYAKVKRQRRYLRSMSKVEMRQRAARDVAAKYGKDALKTMSQERWDGLFEARHRQLYRLRNNMFIVDDYFDQMPFNIDDVSDFLPYH